MTMLSILVPGLAASIALLVFERDQTVQRRILFVVVSFMAAALIWLSGIVLPAFAVPIWIARLAPFVVLFAFAATLWIGMNLSPARTLTYTMILVLGVAAT